MFMKAVVTGCEKFAKIFQRDSDAVFFVFSAESYAEHLGYEDVIVERMREHSPLLKMTENQFMMIETKLVGLCMDRIMRNNHEVDECYFVSKVGWTVTEEGMC